MARILIVDDEPDIRATLEGILQRQGYETVTAGDIAQGARHLRPGDPPDVALVDLLLPDGEGTALLTRIRDLGLPTAVVMISGHGSIPAAVEAVKQGAFDFLEKPPDRERLLITLRNAARQAAATRKSLRDLSVEFPTASPRMEAVLEEAGRLAPTSAPLLISGETGSGKEVLARWIHSRSRRREEPFVALNCAALPESLAESELFGHAKGAFTGADAPRKGKFQVASGGTLFLDEIGDLSLPIQAKLLRVVEEGAVEPVGSDRPVPVDVRILAASHRNLEERCRTGLFRDDLLFRIGGFPLRIPPLRERPEDVPLLARRFFAAIRARQGWPEAELPDAFIGRLAGNPWPGNVRELRFVVERAALLAGPSVPGPAHAPALALERGGTRPGGTRGRALADAESTAIADALAASGGNMTRAAGMLGLSRSRLYDRIKDLGIRPSDYRGETRSR
jgi:two-component system nitrogen regulation response regulator NtrX